MKNSKRLFILIEAVLAVMVVILAAVMLREKNGKALDKVSVIIQDSDDNQWSAFRYGLRMAAEDQKIEMFVVSTGGGLTAEEAKSMIEREIENGADAVIVQPVPGADTEKMLRNMEKKIPVMLVGCAASKEKGDSVLPTTEPDNYAMGTALAEELLKDYNGNINGKTLGILSEAADSEAAVNREKGFRDVLRDTGAVVSWSVYDSFEETEENLLVAHPRVDLVVALDDNSLTTAGKMAAAKNLHGALVYGIGNSTEAIYYLDTGFAECLVVPDEFNVGYQSLTEAAESLKHSFHKMQDRTVSYTVIRRDTLFSKENQEVLFTMSQ